jgi:phosphate-selective porin OprO/OprP
VQAGRFWRTTPGVIWYMTDIFRLEANYGYGTLDRFDLRGHTQFFQCRLQIWL